ncbi:beta-lactamase [bacterium BMS3Abin02]|nr:beta-lactamase [bacterium BMS3Abin02]
MQRLVDTGRLTLDTPVAYWWPEFARGGKEGITVTDMLTHGARLPYPPGYAEIVTADGPEGWDRGDVQGGVPLVV